MAQFRTATPQHYPANVGKDQRAAEATCGDQCQPRAGRMHTIEINGVKLAFFEQGKGEPIVFVHGNISDHRTWDPLLPVLSGQFKAVTYSRRFHWPNHPIPDGADDPFLEHVADLESLIEARRLAPATLVGNSSGAFVSLLLAHRRPDLVRALVLEEPPVVSLFARMPPRPGELLRLLFTRPGAAFGIVKFGARAIEPALKAFRRGDDEAGLRHFLRGVLGPEFYAKVTAERFENMRLNLEPHRAVLLGSGLPVFQADEARRVRTPTLLLRGEHTASFERHIMQRLAELLPASELQVIPNASHLMHEDNGPATARAILQFLERIAQDRAAMASARWPR
jgi:pimeloyl-ACP methyl ester carboxylesterase